MADPARRRRRHQDHGRRGRGARADPPRRRPHHGPRRAGAVARHQGHHRPGDRERLVLRLRPRRPLHPRRPRRDREKDEGNHCEAGRSSHRRVGPHRRHPPLREPRRALQGRADRRHSRRPADPHVLARRLAGPVPRPALPAHRPGPRRRVQADARGRRLLARRQQPRPAPADLWRGLPEPPETQGLPALPRGSGKARPPPPRPRDAPLPLPGGGAGHGVLAPRRLDHLPRAGRLHAPPPHRGRLSRDQDAPGRRPQAVGGLRPLGESTAKTCT